MFWGVNFCPPGRTKTTPLESPSSITHNRYMSSRRYTTFEILYFLGGHIPPLESNSGGHTPKGFYSPEILLHAFGILRIPHSVFELFVSNFSITQPQKNHTLDHPQGWPLTRVTRVWYGCIELVSLTFLPYNFSSIYNRLGAMVRKPPNRQENKRYNNNLPV